MNAAAIQNEALNLSATEKAKLIDLLWDSLSEPEIKARESAWAAESERRIDAFEAGKLKARDAGEVFGDLKRDLRS
jgi:putative addiction module component (TIGR02574 family)